MKRIQYFRLELLILDAAEKAFWKVWIFGIVSSMMDTLTYILVWDVFFTANQQQTLTGGIRGRFSTGNASQLKIRTAVAKALLVVLFHPVQGVCKGARAKSTVIELTQTLAPASMAHARLHSFSKQKQNSVAIGHIYMCMKSFVSPSLGVYYHLHSWKPSWCLYTFLNLYTPLIPLLNWIHAEILTLSNTGSFGPLWFKVDSLRIKRNWKFIKFLKDKRVIIIIIIMIIIMIIHVEICHHGSYFFH